jgi:cobalt-precorrin 5A hydrolase
VDDREHPLPPEVLVVRPPSLVVGIGCNRGTPAEEIEALLRGVLTAFGLSFGSLAGMATVDLKRDEPGLLALADRLGMTLAFHSREALNQVRHVPNPSAMAAKYIGVESVCEAAAMLTAGEKILIVPKQKNRNVTVAVARRPSSSSASARAI